MIKKLICFIWGHSTVHKAYTGEKMNVVGALGNSYTISLYKYETTPFCTRCGNPATKRCPNESNRANTGKKGIKENPE